MVEAILSKGKKEPRILVITALREELISLLERFGETDEIPSKQTSLIYHYLRRQSDAVFITSLFNMGNVVSATKATAAIQEIQPDIIFAFGLAAGISSRVKLASVIVSTSIVYIESSKVFQEHKESRYRTEQSDGYLLTTMQDFCVKELDYEVNFGTIAVGEKVIANNDLVAKFKQEIPKLIGIEMESYGIHFSAREALNSPRCITVRGVSDFADNNKNDGFRQSALENAADFLCSFLSTANLIHLYKNPNSVPLSKLSTRDLVAIHHLSLDYRSFIFAELHSVFGEVLIQEIDQTEFFSAGSISSPKDALLLQQTVPIKIDELIKKRVNVELGYFGLAHVPFVFYLGFSLNTKTVSLYHAPRPSREWQSLAGTSDDWENLKTENIPEKEDNSISDVVFKLEISSYIGNNQILDVLPNAKPETIIRLYISNPHLEVVNSLDQVEAYGSSFSNTKTRVVNLYPALQRIHIFFAGPPFLAFRLGQLISNTFDPEVIVYNFSKKDKPNYGWAINLNSSKVIDYRE